MHVKTSICSLMGLALAAALALPAHADEPIFPYPIYQQTLDNGLKVVAIPYDSPGTVAYYTVVRTGSRDEVEPGHSGFAHFFEHMMFRGTDKYSNDRYNEILKRMGADSNAYTTDDRTVYHILGPAASLETMFDIESDRFKNLKYDEDAFRTEALAVLGEYNKNASSPFLPMYEKMRDLAFTEHTYKHTTLGFIADVKAMPNYYEYSLRFHDRYYRPENCVLMVVGDIHPEQVFELARKYYDDWKPGYKAPAITPEPPPTGEHQAHIDWPGEIRPQMFEAFRAPAFSVQNVDTAALDLISQLLFSESAPLYQDLVVDKQWVDNLDGGYSDHRDPYLFEITTQVKSEDLIPKVQAAIAEAADKLKETPVDVDRLERIKSHLRYQVALSMDSPGAIAGTLAGYLGLTGDPNTINQVYENYAKVTPADIQRVAKEVFDARGETVVTLSHKTEETADKEEN